MAALRLNQRKLQEKETHTLRETESNEQEGGSKEVSLVCCDINHKTIFDICKYV